MPEDDVRSVKTEVVYLFISLVTYVRARYIRVDLVRCLCCLVNFLGSSHFMNVLLTLRKIKSSLKIRLIFNCDVYICYYSTFETHFLHLLQKSLMISKGGLIRSRKSKKDRQYIMTKRKWEIG